MVLYISLLKMRGMYCCLGIGVCSFLLVVGGNDN